MSSALTLPPAIVISNAAVLKTAKTIATGASSIKCKLTAVGCNGTRCIWVKSTTAKTKQIEVLDTAEQQSRGLALYPPCCRSALFEARYRRLLAQIILLGCELRMGAKLDWDAPNMHAAKPWCSPFRQAHQSHGLELALKHTGGSSKMPALWPAFLERASDSFRTPWLRRAVWSRMS